MSARFKLIVFFTVLFAVLLAARICHSGILWPEETLPLAAARQMLFGKTLYRDIWFDKPPLLPVLYLLWGAHPGQLLRLGGAAYALVCCAMAYGFARDLWSKVEGVWAAGLLGFFLVFDLPSAVIPVASDLLLLAPHLAAVWLAWKRKPLWCGIVLGAAFLISPKAVFVGAACLLFYPRGIWQIAAGFALVEGAAAAWLWQAEALDDYWNEVFRWGRLYANAPFSQAPFRNGLLRTVNWAGFHAALVIAAGWFLARVPKASSHSAHRVSLSPPGTDAKAGEPVHASPGRPFARAESSARLALAWVCWLLFSALGVAAGWRFFPRYYFLVLAPLVVAGARGMMLLGRRRDIVALLLLVPATRFGPRYVWLAAGGTGWADTAMDRDSRQAAALVKAHAREGDTLFVWGFRPEMYVYTGLPAATEYLDSQPLTGVPADRHLTLSEPLETGAARKRRLELAQSDPTFVIDGLGAYNPRLAISRFPELRDWLAHYRVIAHSGQSTVYELRSHAGRTAQAGEAAVLQASKQYRVVHW